MNFKRYCASIKLSDYAYLPDYSPEMIRDVEFRAAALNYILDYYPMPKDDGYVNDKNLILLQTFYKMFMLGDLSHFGVDCKDKSGSLFYKVNNKGVAIYKDGDKEPLYQSYSEKQSVLAIQKRSIKYIIENDEIDNWSNYVYSFIFDVPVYHHTDNDRIDKHSRLLGLSHNAEITNEFLLACLEVNQTVFKDKLLNAAIKLEADPNDYSSDSSVRIAYQKRRDALIKVGDMLKSALLQAQSVNFVANTPLEKIRVSSPFLETITYSRMRQELDWYTK